MAKELKVGDRVSHRHNFLSDGKVIKVVKYFGYVVKLDEKAPNEYAWETDEILCFPNDIEKIKES